MPWVTNVVEAGQFAIVGEGWLARDRVFRAAVEPCQQEGVGGALGGGGGDRRRGGGLIVRTHLRRRKGRAVDRGVVDRAFEEFAAAAPGAEVEGVGGRAGG